MNISNDADSSGSGPPTLNLKSKLHKYFAQKDFLSAQQGGGRDMTIEVIRCPTTVAQLLTEISPYELGARRLLPGAAIFTRNPTLDNIVTIECKALMFMLALLELKWRDNLPMGLPVDFVSAVGRIRPKMYLDGSDLEAVIAGYVSLSAHMRFLVDMRYVSATERVML